MNKLVKVAVSAIKFIGTVLTAFFVVSMFLYHEHQLAYAFCGMSAFSLAIGSEALWRSIENGRRFEKLNKITYSRFQGVTNSIGNIMGEQVAIKQRIQNLSDRVLRL